VFKVLSPISRPSSIHRRARFRTALFGFPRWLIAGYCLLSASIVIAQIDESVPIHDELDIPVIRYAVSTENAPILLWLPSSRGTSNQQAQTALGLQNLAIETWLIDLHSAYFVDAGRNSTQFFQAADIEKLITVAASRTQGKIYLVATDSVAKLALEAIALSQQQAEKMGKQSPVRGVILFHPGLSYRATEPGMPVEYLPIAKNSTIPIYFIQPSISTRTMRSQELQTVLQSGGSPVFMHSMKGVNAGFHMRPDEDLNEADFKQRKRLPIDLKQAIQLLSIQAIADTPETVSGQKNTDRPGRRFGLNKLNERTAHALILGNLEANTIAIDYAKNKLNLVSFWASWCQPCIDELPSLKRLHDDYADKGLRVITVNIGETAEDVQRAIKTFSMSSYTNLLDLDGEAMTAWNVYGFPSNFLVTQAGDLRYGSIGGVAWDEPEVRERVDSLLKP
jgi:thiol-disulfide isomerase/thioredoxin